MSDSPRILRKKTGNFLEDFRLGQVFRHKGGKTRHRGPLHHLHRVLDDHEPAGQERALRARPRLRGAGLPAGPRDARRLQPDRRGRLRERAREPRVHRHALRRAGLRGRHARGRDQGAGRARARGAGRTSASCTCRRRRARTSAPRDEAVVATWQRKVQVYKQDPDARAGRGRGRRRTPSTASSGSRPTTPPRDYGRSRTSRTATPTSRTSSPARASSTRAAAP